MAKQGIFQRLRLDWPLLGKELREQAARKQMYVVRVTYAVVLFGAFCFYYMRHLAEGAVFTLGRGMGPFHFLVTAQLVTIYLFLPPLMAGALAQEKERDTLGLLFLTDLTPWELILQKYFGRLIPMLTLLFLSLPLLAVAYSLGGVSAAMLYSSAAGLFLTCLWIGALALACSAYDATTFQALVRCWGISVAFVMCCTLGPFPFWAMMAPTFGAAPRGLNFLFPTLFTMICYLMVTWFCLARAKQVLESRAFVQRRNPFGQQFKHLDQYWKDMRHLIRAMLRERDGEAHALAKRVVRQGLGATGDEHGWSLGRFLLMRMQVPNVLAFGVIAGVIVLIALVTNVALDPKSGGAFYVVVGGIWILGLLTVPVQSANAVASERMNERLGAILTTSLTAQEILHEWLGPVRRWIQFLVRPLIIIIVVEAIVKFKAPMNKDDPRVMNVALYLGLSLLTVLVYPALVQWSCLWIGLRVRNQIRALMTSLLVVTAWCLLPVTVAGYLVETGLLPGEWNGPVQFVSPVTVISTAEAIGRSSRSHGMGIDTDTLIIAFMHLGLVAVLALVIRRHCLNNADRYLGRI